MSVEGAVPMCLKYHITAALTSLRDTTTTITTTGSIESFPYTVFAVKKTAIYVSQSRITVCFGSQNYVAINKTTLRYTVAHGKDCEQVRQECVNGFKY